MRSAGRAPTKRLAGGMQAVCAAALLWLGSASGQAPPTGDFPPGGPPGEGPPDGGPPGGDAFEQAIIRMMMPPLPPDSPKAPADPKNLEGTWYHRENSGNTTKDMFGRSLPMKPEAKAILEHRRTSERAGKPIVNASARCYPPGQNWQMDLNFPFQIIQTKGVIYFVHQEFHGVWTVRMNAKHRSSGPREYMGDSIGYWDGDTLVIDTLNYKDPLWIDIPGTPSTTGLHMVNRIRKIDDGQVLEVIRTYDDPALYTAPFSVARSFVWRPDKMIFDEYNCEQQLGEEGGLELYGGVSEES